MIGSWLVKVVVGIALIGFLVIELGSPLITRAQVDEAAHEVADNAAFRLLNEAYEQRVLEDACKTKSEEQEVELQRCELNEKQEVSVTVTKEARSLLLGKIDALADWYTAEATATASAAR